MIASRTYVSEYTNEYGEEWIFEFKPETGKAVVKGSDVDWEEYAVTEGYAFGLVMNEGELQWLRKAWADAIASKPGPTDGNR